MKSHHTIYCKKTELTILCPKGLGMKKMTRQQLVKSTEIFGYTFSPSQYSLSCIVIAAIQYNHQFLRGGRGT